MEHRCVFCGNAFVPAKHMINRQLYCSPKCRMKQFYAKNPSKAGEYHRRAYYRTPLLCRNCHLPISERKKGRLHCSPECVNETRRKNARRKHAKDSAWFLELKESIGCQLCGYNKFGGALDFHHVDPNCKDRRITDKHLVFFSPLILRELEKCVLLCKNCHYEVHYFTRKKDNADHNEDKKEIANGPLWGEIDKEYQ